MRARAKPATFQKDSLVKGGKTIPTALKLVKGNPGKRKLHPEREARIPCAAPEPPEFLNADGKVEWERICSMLARAGLMTGADRGALGSYCQAYGVWAQAERAINKLAEEGEINSLVMRTTNGNVVQHVMVGIARRARMDVVRYAIEFGMTPSSRSRIHVNPSGDEDPVGIEKYFAAS
jgi:P27 family predicted phage terminase small subunit